MNLAKGVRDFLVVKCPFIATKTWMYLNMLERPMVPAMSLSTSSQQKMIFIKVLFGTLPQNPSHNTLVK